MSQRFATTRSADSRHRTPSCPALRTLLRLCARTPSPSRDRVHDAAGALGPLHDIAVTPHVAHPQAMKRLGEILRCSQLRNALTAQPSEQLGNLRRADHFSLHSSKSRRLPTRHLPIRHLPTTLGICLATNSQDASHMSAKHTGKIRPTPGPPAEPKIWHGGRASSLLGKKVRARCHYKSKKSALSR